VGRLAQVGAGRDGDALNVRLIGILNENREVESLDDDAGHGYLLPNKLIGPSVYAINSDAEILAT